MRAIRPGAVVSHDALGAHAIDPSAAASGLEGAVVECDHTPYLYKIYERPRTGEEAAALQRLIDLKEHGFTADDRERASRSFSWPTHRVIDGSGLTTGVLIPRAEARFSFAFGGRWHLRDGQHLARAESVAGSFDLVERTRFVADIAWGWDLLDRHRLVYSDANSRNIVFAPSGSPSAYLLDCDGIRPEADPTLQYRTHPNWSDPYTVGATVAADRYLLAVWILRVLAASMIRPQPTSSDADALPAVPHRSALRRLVSRGLGAPGDRPAPAEYLARLR